MDAMCLQVSALSSTTSYGCGSGELYRSLTNWNGGAGVVIAGSGICG